MGGVSLVSLSQDRTLLQITGDPCGKTLIPSWLCSATQLTGIRPQFLWLIKGDSWYNLVFLFSQGSHGPDPKAK